MITNKVKRLICEWIESEVAYIQSPSIETAISKASAFGDLLNAVDRDRIYGVNPRDFKVDDAITVALFGVEYA